MTEPLVTDLRKQMSLAALEAVKPEPNKVEITGAPAIVVRRSIGEAISRGDLVSGQNLPGTELYLVTAWEPTNRKGERLGRTIAGFTSRENLPGSPSNFDRNIVKIGRLKGWHGHDGWKFDRQRYGTSSYEDARFKSYQDKSGFGLWGAPELPLINGKDRNGKPVRPDENMVVLNNNKRLSNGAKNRLYNTFAERGWPCYVSGYTEVERPQSCTEYPHRSSLVATVWFGDGSMFDAGRVDERSKSGYRSRVRPVVPLELSHLIL